METKTAKSYGFQVLEQLPEGTTLYTILRRVSRSGMTRVIDLKYINTDNKPCDIILQELKCCAKDYGQEKKWGGNYKVTGYGMDMGFWLICEIGCLVHQNGYYFNHSWL